MKHTNLTASKSEQTFSLDGFGFPNIMTPTTHKWEMVQVHHFFTASGKSAISLQIYLKGAESKCKHDLADAQNNYSINSYKFSYRQTENQFSEGLK